MAEFDDEFQEIAHCGGQYRVTVERTEGGKLAYRIGCPLRAPFQPVCLQSTRYLRESRLGLYNLAASVILGIRRPIHPAIP